MTPAADADDALFEYLLRLGDNALILSHRLCEWCGNGPVLEEDLAISNVALDLLGQARYWLGQAGEVENKGRDADTLAFTRDGMDFRNALLVELPRGDFARTTARQFLFDHWHLLLLEALAGSSEPRVADGAVKAVKEVRYHVERSDEWMVLLGDGTGESRDRINSAVCEMWPYTGELFESDGVVRTLADKGVTTLHEKLRDPWRARVERVLKRATIEPPADSFMHGGGYHGVHTEHLGYLLAEMQFLQRAYPGAQW